MFAPAGANEPHPAMFPPKAGTSVSLAEFAPAGANKVRSFFSATCASKKIPIAERSVDRPAKRDDEARSGVRSPRSDGSAIRTKRSKIKLLRRLTSLRSNFKMR